jgi:hypothetical protein
MPGVSVRTHTGFFYINFVKECIIMITRKIIGYGIAVILALAFSALSLTGCEQPIDSPTVTTLTGITANYTGGSVAINTDVNSLKNNLTVTALYGNGATKTLGSTEYTLSGDLSASGQKTVTVIYAGKTTTFTVTVTAAPNTNITYTAIQTGGADKTGDSDGADSTGIVFTFSASVDNLTAADITIGGTATKGTTALSGTGTTRTLAITVNSAGTATVSINKTGIEAGTKNVTVFKQGETAPTLTGITAVYNGTIAIYPTTPLDNLKANLTVKAQYTGNGENTLSENEYTLSGTLTVGTSTVTVSYTDRDTQTITFTVTVIDAPTLTGITLNTISVKQAYIQNEMLNLSGLVVTAAYSNNASATVTGYTSNPVNGATLTATGQITVTVSYTEGTITKTASFIVNVTGGSVPGGNGQLTVSGLPEGDWGVIVYTSGAEVTYRTITDNTQATGNAAVTGGGNVIPIVGLGSGSGWTASGSFPVVLTKMNGSSMEGNAYDHDNPMYRLATVNFSGGIGTSDFSAFVPVVSETLTINNLPSYNKDDFSMGGPYLLLIYSASTSIPTNILGMPDITAALATSTIASALGGSKYYQFVMNYNYANTGKMGLFDGEGDYRILLSDGRNGGSLPVYLVATVNFANGDATMDYSDFTNPDGSDPNKTLTGITLDTVSVKTVYEQNDWLSLYGLVVTANYSDSSSATVINYTSNPANNTVLTGTGEITVTVSYTEGAVTETATFTVTVIDLTIGTEGLVYELINTGTNANTYRVRKGSVTGGLVVIPDTYNDLPITEIGSASDDYYAGAFRGTDITTVHIPASITSIGSYAFYYCGNLTSITIPASVTSIGNEAFRGCTSLTSITIPAGVTSIGEGTFRECSSLTSVTIPASVTSIGDYAFSGCNSLTSITIPASVTSIGKEAFTGTGLVNITFALGSQLQNIGSYAFYYCGNLTSITIPASVTSISQEAFYGCSSLTSVTFATNSQLQSIGYQVFYGCTSLTSITIPDSVTSISELAFSSSTNLTNITVNADNQNYASQDGILYNKAKTTLIQAPGGINGTVTIPASVTSIGASAFRGCTSLTSITIPTSVTSIGTSAFRGCTSLTSITIGTGVTSIGESAFYDCTNLISVTIPASVTSIGNEAFRGCTSLTDITIPAGVTSIGQSAFFNCTSLTSITIPAGVTSIGEYTFRGCTSLTSVTIPESVTSIGIDAFENCTSLTSVTIPEGVTSIGSRTFAYCTSLPSITIPNSVTSIGTFAFQYCTSLTNITIPASVTTISTQAFSGCNGLTSVTFAGTIASGSFSTDSTFPGDLRAKYLAGGIGTYTRPSGSSTWTKQP